MMQAELRRVSRACQGRWPGVAPATDEAVLAVLLDGEPAPGLAHLEDLWLARACVARDAVAIKFFDDEFLQPTMAVSARLDPSPEFRDELTQIVRELLFAPRRGAPRIADYRGHGALSSWTRAIALRAGLRLKKALDRQSPDAAIEEAAATASPELSFIKEQHRGVFQSAVEATLRSLDRRDRTLLRMHFVEGIGLEWLANAHGVHRTTIVRWLASARATVLRRTRAQMSTLLKLQAPELDSLVDLMSSHLELSLTGLLRSTEP